ncbi:hypothetical protein NG791_27425 [Laspinema sp. D1]|uniref:hypothetical protein n=1 Tax=Laspinema palackyanum TaxID=3231601 RepID=UPI00348B86CD|nr:hypothetical protein [Laspinema sp. D2b]
MPSFRPAGAYGGNGWSKLNSTRRRRNNPRRNYPRLKHPRRNYPRRSSFSPP